jgi:hypothetical protein
MRISTEDVREQQQAEARIKVREKANEAVTASLTKTLGQLGEAGKAYATAMVNKIVGETKAFREKVTPPAGTRWGGVILAKRDLEHCSCGLRFSEHSAEALVGLTCPIKNRFIKGKGPV